ncbi:hypothetical protein [Maridesulfovibrio sp.]|uniref:hypothetical protein n=1 Tax=Maridesulfovibrio sp. TaxID=2795000 RepID=UPI003B008C83
MDLEEATQKGNQIKEIKRLETAPPPVRKDYGWSPYLAIDFLEELDFKTNGYHEIFGEWGASSSPVLLGKKELFQNKLGYYVYGSKLIAKTLRVVLNVNVPNEIDSALNSFVLASSILYEKATSMPLPSKFKHNIFNETIFEVKQGSYVIKLYKEEWENSKGYDLRFSIQIKEL